MQNNYGMPSNQYFNPYAMPGQTGTNNRPQLQQYAFVNGIEEANAYPVIAGQSMLLMDQNASLCYMKSVDATGKAKLTFYKLDEMDEVSAREYILSQQPQSEYVSRKEYDALNKKLEDILKRLDSKQPKKEVKEVNA